MTMVDTRPENVDEFLDGSPGAIAAADKEFMVAYEAITGKATATEETPPDESGKVTATLDPATDSGKVTATDTGTGKEGEGQGAEPTGAETQTQQQTRTEPDPELSRLQQENIRFRMQQEQATVAQAVQDRTAQLYNDMIQQGVDEETATASAKKYRDLAVISANEVLSERNIRRSAFAAAKHHGLSVEQAEELSQAKDETGFRATLQGFLSGSNSPEVQRMQQQLDQEKQARQTLEAKVEQLTKNVVPADQTFGGIVGEGSPGTEDLAGLLKRASEGVRPGGKPFGDADSKALVAIFDQF